MGDPGQVHSSSSLEQCKVRHGWGDLLSRQPWSYFLTLTFDPKRFARSGPESWLSSWRWFLFAWLSECAIQAGKAHRDDRGRLHGPWANAWRHGRGRPVWCLALEPHADGRLHAHVLLRLTSDLPWLDWSVGQRLWADARGLCRFEVPRSKDHVSNYVAKYVVKFGSDAITLSENFDAPRMAVAAATVESSN